MLTHMTVRNVREALPLGMSMLRTGGVRSDSRVGECLVMPGPVVTEYIQPGERVLLDPARDANPFFHLMEAFWMLSGRRDVASISLYNRGFVNYSDDGETYHAAYGHRWRHHFDCDQIADAVAVLRRDPMSRRVVISMWDPLADLGGHGVDLPCNTTIYLRLRDELVSPGTPEEALLPPPRYLDLTVTCRSNDAIWGAHGANAVHFSVLQEFIAALLGVRMGRLYQFSNNYHMYTEVAGRIGALAPPPVGEYPETIPLFGDLSALHPTDVMGEIETLWDGDADGEVEHLPVDTIHLVCNTQEAWRHWKAGSIDRALVWVGHIPHPDWRQAMTEWLERRRK